MKTPFRPLGLQSIVIAASTAVDGFSRAAAVIVENRAHALPIGKSLADHPGLVREEGFVCLVQLSPLIEMEN